MLTYKLDRKQISDCIRLYEHLLLTAEKDCTLIIDDTYYIERFIDDDFMFHVHVKDNGRIIDKICVYQKEK